MRENNIYQDNQSATRMERNGRRSCTGNLRHISIRYFFVKDRIDKGEVEVKYCPSEHMLADFFTKPLQGNVFRVFHEVIMGHQPLSWLKEKLVSTKDRVGNRKKILVDNNVHEKSNAVLKNTKRTVVEVVKNRCFCEKNRLVLTKLN